MLTFVKDLANTYKYMDSILVIGGSSGIGYELSNKLASQGFDVFATYNLNKVNSEKTIYFTIT